MDSSLSRQSASAETVFAFGRNWQSFARGGIDERRITAAAASLRRLLDTDDLGGRSFLDVGCGSGLFSLAAVALGAARVVAFDADAAAVETASDLRRRAGVAAADLQILHGSILDADFVAALQPAAIVYAWGSLHHTGAMWQAIDNAAALVEPGGMLALAIYDHVRRRIGGSAQWWAIKRFYNRVPRPVQWSMEWAYIAQRAARDLATGRSPLLRMRAYGERRGMDFRHDVRDWLGGFPYEYASAEAVRDHVLRLGFELRRLERAAGHGCNELTFRRPATP